tara:strand:+ start:1067 stop:1351 length:285 start_codon:yes stop_codon:yes gene_type:complete
MLESVKICDQKTLLELKWLDGDAGKISAIKLRNNAMDAVALRARYDGKELNPHVGLQILAVNRMGNSAFNIQFSDGHIRAIYPFEFLKELSEQP